MATSHENGWWPGAKRQKKRTSPRSRRDNAKYKEGSERNVQRLKGRSVGPCSREGLAGRREFKMDEADLVLHNAFEEMSVSDVHHGDKNSR